MAIEHHDIGYVDVDDTLVVDPATRQLLDFTELPDALKRETSWRGIDLLAHDPYAAALAAQHRLHVYRQYSGKPDWQDFFAAVTNVRDLQLRTSGAGTLEQLLRDYAFVRAGDLASLAFCNNWLDTPDDGCGYAMRLEGTTLTIVPDPLAGQSFEIEIDAREIATQPFESAEEARARLAAGPVMKLTGIVRGMAA